MDRRIFMKVYYKTMVKKRTTVKEPMIRISNKKLTEHGFTVGKEYEITYNHNELIIRGKT